MTEIIIRYLHFLGIMSFSVMLVSEHLMLTKEVALNKLKKIAFIDAFYGISALLIIITGLLQWFLIGKPADYYNTNFIFHLKVTLFVIMVLLSFYPSIFILKNRKSKQENIAIPKSIFILIRIELLLLVIIPMLATLMASGFGSIN